MNLQPARLHHASFTIVRPKRFEGHGQSAIPDSVAPLPFDLRAAGYFYWAVPV